MFRLWAEPGPSSSRPSCVSSDELLSENFLDYKNRGISGSHRGQIIWKIDSGSHFSEGASSSAGPSVLSS